MAGLRKGQVKKTPEERKAIKRAWYLRNREISIKRATSPRTRANSDQWRRDNREHVNERVRQRRNTPKGREAQAHHSLLRRFAVHGLTLDQYHAIMESQDFQCAICKEEPVDNYGGFHDGFHIDHHHGSGRVRGLLCKHCNVGLGMLKDSPEVCHLAGNYLEQRSVASS